MKRLLPILLATAGLALAACGARMTPPSAGASAAPAASSAPKPDVDRAIGLLVDMVFMMDRQLYPDPELAAYVRKIGRKVAARADVHGIEPTFEVTDETAVNAWSVPGGHVYISRAALAVIDSEAELAGVLGHELGHLAARHPLHEFYLSALDTRGDSDGIDADQYQREQEYQADRLGAGYVRAAGYDPRATVKMLEALYRVGSCPDGDATPREERIARLWRHVGDATGGVVAGDALLDRIDGLVWGEDPRAGALRGQTFTCERCGFAFDLPKGWKGEVEDHHLKASLKDEAALSFRHVGSSTTFPVRELLVAQVQASPFTMETIGGIPALTGVRESKGDQQHIAILSSGQEAWSLAVTGKNADRALRMVLSTLRRVEPGDASLAPQRIRIRTVQRSGRFSAVVRELCGASETMKLLSALNGLGPDEAVTAGRRVKCISRER